MKTKVIMDAVQWEIYKQTFPVPKANHVPTDPPSFPCLVVSQTTFDGMAVHSFIEVHDLKQMLGLA
jgi:hypothetical protein